MDIEKAVAKAAGAGTQTVIRLADRMGEKAHVIYDIAERNHPEVYEGIKKFFQGENE